MASLILIAIYLMQQLQQSLTAVIYSSCLQQQLLNAAIALLILTAVT